MPHRKHLTRRLIKQRLSALHHEEAVLIIDKASRAHNPEKVLLEHGLGIRQLRARNIFPATLRKQYRFTANHLRALGFSPREMLTSFGLSELSKMEHVFTAQEWKKSGIPVSALLGAGFGVHGLLDAGFTIKEIFMVKVKRMKWAQKEGPEVKLSGLLGQLKKHGVKLRDARGILVKKFHTATDYKRAGLTALHLRNLGYELRDLIITGFHADELLEAGFTPINLLRGGFSQASVSFAISKNRKKQKKKTKKDKKK